MTNSNSSEVENDDDKSRFELLKDALELTKMKCTVSINGFVICRYYQI